jgi:hypothetical protein
MKMAPDTRHMASHRHHTPTHPHPHKHRNPTPTRKNGTAAPAARGWLVFKSAGQFQSVFVLGIRVIFNYLFPKDSLPMRPEDAERHFCPPCDIITRTRTRPRILP